MTNKLHTHPFQGLEKAVSEKEAIVLVCEDLLQLKGGGYTFCAHVVYELYTHPDLIDTALLSVLNGIDATGT